MGRVEHLKEKLRRQSDVGAVGVSDPVSGLSNGSLHFEKGRFIEIFEELLDVKGHVCGFYHSFTGGWFKDCCAARCDFNGITIDYEREGNVGRLIQNHECIGQLRFSSSSRVFYWGNVELFMADHKYADLILPTTLGLYSWEPAGGKMSVNVRLPSGDSFGVRCAGFGGEFISDGKRFFADESEGNQLHARVVAACMFCMEMAV